MDIRGVDRFWFKTTIGEDGRISSVLAILTRIPLVPAEEDYDAAEAARFLREVGAYKELNKIDTVEILRGVGGP